MAALMRSILLLAAATTVLAVDKGRIPTVSHIFVDFDGTIAVTEAFENLAAAAYASVPANSSVPPWSYFSDVYNEEYEAFSNRFGNRTTLAREIAFQSSSGLRKVEAESFDRVAASRAFSFATASSIATAAATVTLRAGWWEFVAFSLAEGLTPTVVSLNWSPQWIRAVLRADATRIAAGGNSYKSIRWLAEAVDIYCGELLSPGVVSPSSRRDHPVRLHTGADKVALVRRLAKQPRDVIFIGDSKADLPPLTQSPTTIGVVALGSSSMAAALQLFEVPVRRANSTGPLTTSTGRGFLWSLETFQELIGKFRGPL